MKNQSTTTTASVSQNNAQCTKGHSGNTSLVRNGDFLECQGCGTFYPLSFGAPVGAQSTPTDAKHVLRQWEVWGNPGEMDICVGPVGGGVAICQVVTVDGRGVMTEETAKQGAANAFLLASAPALRDAIQLILTTHRVHPNDPDPGYAAAQAALALAGTQEPAPVAAPSYHDAKTEGALGVLRDLVASQAAYEAGAITLDTFEDDVTRLAHRADYALTQPAAESSVERELRRDLAGTSAQLAPLLAFVQNIAARSSLGDFALEARQLLRGQPAPAPVAQSVNVALLEALRTLEQSAQQWFEDIEHSEYVNQPEMLAARAAVAAAEKEMGVQS